MSARREDGEARHMHGRLHPPSPGGGGSTPEGAERTTAAGWGEADSPFHPTPPPFAREARFGGRPSPSRGGWGACETSCAKPEPYRMPLMAVKMRSALISLA